jgi:hypothetical protein
LKGLRLHEDFYKYRKIIASLKSWPEGPACKVSFIVMQVQYLLDLDSFENFRWKWEIDTTQIIALQDNDKS